ncbi:NEET group protein [Hibiscus trionum]|uniref:NEET group protein n=1 Tax=Hibiscus trionum TaxID=183268 RepID=A0A9W7MMT2_HIBTR|nr:NEET group protein [Hibiscus trionum]
MASTLSTFGSGICHQNVSPTALGLSPKPSPAICVNPRRRRSSGLVVRAEGQTINPEIRKTEEKVVDSVVVTELSKPLTPYCRCWRSGTFPLCDGSHVKHNKATGDNVGPLLLKKQ